MESDSQNADRIHLKNFVIPSLLNLNRSKPKELVPLTVNLTLHTEFGDAGSLDDLNKSIDYARVAEAISNLSESNKELTSLEELAQEICRISINKFAAQKVSVRVEQANAFFNVGSSGIQITRTAEDLSQERSNCTDIRALPNDILIIDKLVVSTIIGVENFEREDAQQLETSLEIYPRVQIESSSQNSSCLQDVVRGFTEHIRTAKYGTVEALINSLSVLGLEEFQFSRLKIRLDKPNAIPWADAASVEVDNDQKWLYDNHKYTRTEIDRRESGVVLIGIGSNIGTPIKNINHALGLLNSHENCQIIDSSFLYETTPMYLKDQPNFLNGVIKIQTTLVPHDLLRALKIIEAQVGRIDSIRNSPRLIDLDILYYDNLEIKTDDLVVPRQEMLEREFVLRPLCDIDRNRKHPTLGLTSAQLLSNLLKHSSTEGGGVLDKVLPMYRSSQTTWNWNTKTLIMGILNMSTDSFSGFGYPNVEAAVAAAEQMARDGADVIDIGGMTRKPGADEEAMSPAEEIARVVPLIRALRLKSFPLPISVDTVRAEVATAVIEAGADIINDVSGGSRDPQMLATIARLGVPYIIMHMRGTSATMTTKENTDYGSKGVILDIREQLGNMVAKGISAGIYRWNLILDAGLGFSKIPQDSYTIIRDHKQITDENGRLAGFPTLLGPSRKKFVGTVTGVSEPGKRGYGTAGAVAACVAGGANIIRVHDVKEMVEVAKVADYVWKQNITI